MMGLEPTEPGFLDRYLCQFGYIRIKTGCGRRIRTELKAYETFVLPLHYPASVTGALNKNRTCDTTLPM